MAHLLVEATAHRLRIPLLAPRYGRVRRPRTGQERFEGLGIRASSERDVAEIGVEGPGEQL